MVAFSGSDNPELGAGFVEFMNRTENQQALCEGRRGCRPATT